MDSLCQQWSPLKVSVLHLPSPCLPKSLVLPLFPSEIAETIRCADYYNTFGGNALACAVSSAALDVSWMWTTVVEYYMYAILQQKQQWP